MGKEVVYSELDHSDEEEAPCAPDSECTSLIDSWYDIHPHFPKLPDDYTLPLPSRVWLALCRKNSNVSWAPLAFSIPDLVIHQGTSLLVLIHFEFGSSTALGWREWVDRELFDTVSWGYYSGPVYCRPLFHPAVYLTTGTSSTFTI